METSPGLVVESDGDYNSQELQIANLKHLKNVTVEEILSDKLFKLTFEIM